jgi:hypothetical protein
MARGLAEEIGDEKGLRGFFRTPAAMVNGTAAEAAA